jgi:hypothetical protein
MKFLDYLNEGDDETPEEVVKILKRDCMQFLKEGQVLYRGYKSGEDFFSKVPRKNRRPKDTPKKMHDALDNYFNKKFGWKARSEGLFVTPEYQQARDYGSAFLFFPVDGYKYIWSQGISDLFIDLKRDLYRYAEENIHGYDHFDHFDKVFRSLTKDEFNKFMKEFEKGYLVTYKDNKLQMNRKNEVMVKCDKYYMLNYHFYKTSNIVVDLKEYLYA